MKFKYGDLANVVRANGKEVLVRVVGGGLEGGRYPVQELDPDGEPTEQSWVESEHELLPIRRPGFCIRGLVFTIGTNHRGKEGEIIALGEGPKKQVFYRVKFSDGQAEWLSEDDVFIETKDPTKAGEALVR